VTVDERKGLSPERAVRLLRAKAGELEAQVLSHTRIDPLWLAADLALIAGLLADHMERCGDG
jgi:hypothetical protein